MNPVRVRDNSLTSKEVFSVIPNLTIRVADKTLGQLEKEGLFVFPDTVNETQDLAKDQMVIQGINNTYQTGNVMGFIGYGDERLVISSRFARGESDYFLQYLLGRVMDFPDVLALSTDASQEERIFHLMVFLFPQYLAKAMQKGIYKAYIRRQYNDSNVKGTIDVARHIRENTPFVGSIAYSQREYSYDNSLTELIRHTIELIKRKPYGQRILRKAKDEVKAITDATPGYTPSLLQKIIIENSRNPLRHAYYREYRSLQHLCVMILQHQSHQINTGSNEIYGVLFDGAWLWEEYMNSLVKEICYHPMNKSRRWAQHLFSDRNGLIYPDFMSRDYEQRFIADAKYKPASNIGNEDYLQMLAYMFRFDAGKGFFFYPEVDKDKVPGRKMWLNCGSTFERNVAPRDDISVTKYGFSIPGDSDSYKDFAARMEVSEQEFKDELANSI